MGKRREHLELGKRATRASSSSEVRAFSPGCDGSANQERIKFDKTPTHAKRATRASSIRCVDSNDLSEVGVAMVNASENAAFDEMCGEGERQVEERADEHSIDGVLEIGRRLNSSSSDKSFSVDKMLAPSRRATRAFTKRWVDGRDHKEVEEALGNSSVSENAAFDKICCEGARDVVEGGDEHSNDGVRKSRKLSMECSSPEKAISDSTQKSNRKDDTAGAASDECLTTGGAGQEGEGIASSKRRTRSSSATPAKSNCEAKVVKPSMKCDQLFSRQVISKNELLSQFPGRGLQILDMLRLIGPQGSSMIPLFIYGGVSTGKTSVLLQVFSYLRRPFVYSSCRSCYNSRGLFESVLNQLLFQSRTADNCYSSAKRCDKFSDFVSCLRDALNASLKSLKDFHTKKECDDTMIYMIFDNIELIRDWEKGASLISLLFNLNDLLKMPKVGFIFISNSSPDTFYSSTGFAEPLPIYFSSYTEDELYQIFMRNQPNPKLYASFLHSVLPSFCRVTRHVDELSTSFQALFKKYTEPLDNLNKVPDENTRRRLFTHLQPHIAQSLKELFRVVSPAEIGVKRLDKDNKKRKFNGEISDDLDFHMSLSSKYLLISAFLASRNPATLDAALFDANNGFDKKKRKRKSSETTIQKKDLAAQEQLLKGPGTFPLERLLAIFQCITSVIDDSPPPIEPQAQKCPMETGKNGLMSDVLVQFSMLCDTNFINRGGLCPLEGSNRYRCAVSEDMALKVARSVQFPLSKYLYR